MSSAIVETAPVRTADCIQVTDAVQVLDGEYSVGAIVPYRPMLPALRTFAFRGYTEPRGAVKRKAWAEAQERKAQEERARIQAQFAVSIRVLEALHHPGRALQETLDDNRELVTLCHHNGVREKFIERAEDVRIPLESGSIEGELLTRIQAANQRMRTVCNRAAMEYRTYVAQGGLERTRAQQRRANRCSARRARCQVAQDHLDNELACDGWLTEHYAGNTPEPDPEPGQCTAVAVAVARCG